MLAEEPAHQTKVTAPVSSESFVRPKALSCDEKDDIMETFTSSEAQKAKERERKLLDKSAELRIQYLATRQSLLDMKIKQQIQKIPLPHCPAEQSNVVSLALALALGNFCPLVSRRCYVVCDSTEQHKDEGCRLVPHCSLRRFGFG